MEKQNGVKRVVFLGGWFALFLKPVGTVPNVMSRKKALLGTALRNPLARYLRNQQSGTFATCSLSPNVKPHGCSGQDKQGRATAQHPSLHEFMIRASGPMGRNAKGGQWRDLKGAAPRSRMTGDGFTIPFDVSLRISGAVWAIRAVRPL